MNKKKHIFLILLISTFSNYAMASEEGSKSLHEHEKSHAELEIKQRDNVISELTSILLFQYRNTSKNELISILRSHPAALEDPRYVSAEDNYVFFGAAVKFEFRDNKLINVYW